MKQKLFLCSLFSVFFLAFYVWPNLNPIWHPAYLPLLSIDHAVPFVPWTFIIYTSHYLLMVSALLLLDGESLNSCARMVYTVLIICGPFFIFFPTTYPRPVYPEVDSWIVSSLMAFVDKADRPTNCFPSQHVGLAAVAAWSMRQFGKKTYIFYWIWAIAIFVSTMTTKQHYFMDIIGGLSIAFVACLCEWALFEKGLLRTWLKQTS